LANSVKIDRYLVTATGKASTWMTIGAAVAIALVYFLAARLGLSLLAQPADVAVFWPASGVATGILVAAGRRAAVASVAGVLMGTIAANLVSGMTFFPLSLSDCAIPAKLYWSPGCSSGGLGPHSLLAMCVGWCAFSQRLGSLLQPLRSAVLRSWSS
jgi:hypothetical protein